MLPYNPRSGSLERQMAVMGVGYLNSPQLRLRDVKRLNHIYTARLWRSQDFNPKTYSLFCNAFLSISMNEWMSGWKNEWLKELSSLCSGLQCFLERKDCLIHVPELGRNAITMLWPRNQSLQMSSHLIKNQTFFPIIFFSPKQTLGLSLASWLI